MSSNSKNTISIMQNKYSKSTENKETKGIYPEDKEKKNLF